MSREPRGRSEYKEILPSKQFKEQITAIESTPRGVLHARFPLSEATGSTPTLLTTTAACIHQTSLTAFDEVYLWATNVNASDRVLTCSLGDSSMATNTFIVTLSGQEGLTLVYPGVPHQNIKVFAKASANSSVNLFGYVMRHYPFMEGNTNTGYGGSADD
tara:strand:- start:3949 stop:4428 length:480 start_codon:yes stop_codon:yes gene_type:complete